MSDFCLSVSLLSLLYIYIRREGQTIVIYANIRIHIYKWLIVTVTLCYRVLFISLEQLIDKLYLKYIYKPFKSKLVC
jgi:hypothetical protein